MLKCYRKFDLFTDSLRKEQKVQVFNMSKHVCIKPQIEEQDETLFKKRKKNSRQKKLV